MTSIRTWLSAAAMTACLVPALALAQTPPAAPTQPAAAPAAPAKPVVAGIDGDWGGSLAVGGKTLRLIFHVTTGAEGTSAVIESVDQGGTRIPVTDILRSGAAITFGVSAINGGFVGELSADGKTMTGQWRQGVSSIPLVLIKGGVAPPVAVNRPQTPRPPFPYRAEDVAYDNAKAHVRLAGTLTLPQGPGPFPVALLITGSGPQDRDETILGHKSFLVLADDLTRRGVAVLRVDDRGVGASTGSFAGATTRDFADDVEAGVAFLKTRHDIDSRRIGLIGHSEGGVIAPMVAAEDPSVAWIVMMAGPGLPGDEIIFAQGRLIARAMGSSAEAADAGVAMNRKIFAIVKSEPDSAKAQARIVDLLTGAGMAADAAGTQAASVVGPWFRYYIAYDPAPALRRLRIPVLAVNGGLDLQVPAQENLAAVKAALSADRDVTVVELPGLNHLFQTARTGAPSEYGSIEETIAPSALKVIGDWVAAHARAH